MFGIVFCQSLDQTDFADDGLFLLQRRAVTTSDALPESITQRLAAGTITVAEAKAMCAELPGCKGFSLEYKPAEQDGPVLVHFKSEVEGSELTDDQQNATNGTSEVDSLLAGEQDATNGTSEADSQLAAVPDNGIQFAVFEPVDGGFNRSCRGESPSDHADRYFNLATAVSVDDCKTKCMTQAECVGVEFRSQSSRCELWTRADGIGATAHASGSHCLRLLRQNTTSTGSALAASDGEAMEVRKLTVDKAKSSSSLSKAKNGSNSLHKKHRLFSSKEKSRHSSSKETLDQLKNEMSSADNLGSTIIDKIARLAQSLSQGEQAHTGEEFAEIAALGAQLVDSQGDGPRDALAKQHEQALRDAKQVISKVVEDFEQRLNQEAKLLTKKAVLGTGRHEDHIEVDNRVFEQRPNQKHEDRIEVDNAGTVIEQQLDQKATKSTKVSHVTEWHGNRIEDATRKLRKLLAGDFMPLSSAENQHANEQPSSSHSGRTELANVPADNSTVTMHTFIIPSAAKWSEQDLLPLLAAIASHPSQLTKGFVVDQQGTRRDLSQSGNVPPWNAFEVTDLKFPITFIVWAPSTQMSSEPSAKSTVVHQDEGAVVDELADVNGIPGSMLASTDSEPGMADDKMAKSRTGVVPVSGSPRIVEAWQSTTPPIMNSGASMELQDFDGSAASRADQLIGELAQLDPVEQRLKKRLQAANQQFLEEFMVTRSNSEEQQEDHDADQAWQEMLEDVRSQSNSSEDFVNTTDA